MRVAFLMSHLMLHDAISNYSYDFMKEVSRHHEVSLYVFKTNRNISDLRVIFFTRHHDHNFLEVTKVMIKPRNLVRELSKNDIIVVIVPHASDVFILPLFSKHDNPRLKLVVDFHGQSPGHIIYGSMSYKSFKKYLIKVYHDKTTRYLIRRSDFLIVHSNYMKQQTFRWFQVKADVLPLGIDTKRFDSSIDDSVIKKKFQLENNFVLLYVGRLELHKRVSFLLEALFRLKDENMKLLIVGDGSEKEKLEKYAKALDLTNKVIFVGRVADADLPKYYNVCNVFVTASLHEGVCVPILEAFACGKPAIVPNNTALPETLSGGGLIYPEDSLECLVENIKLLRDDVNLCRELGRKGLRIADQRDSKRCEVEYRLFLELIASSSRKKIRKFL